MIVMVKHLETKSHEEGRKERNEGSLALGRVHFKMPWWLSPNI